MARRARSRNGPSTALVYAAIMLSILAILASVYSIARPGKIVYINKTSYINRTIYVNSSNATKPLTQFNISGTLITPATFLPNAPVVNASDPVGKRLTGINSPLNTTDLSVINNATDSYFEQAGEMIFNKSITNEIGTPAKQVPVFMLNGKPSVIYLGSITCIFCGENRWAMALALSRFGNFSSLYTGYSSFGDGNLPTLYWAPEPYNSSSVGLGDFYNSKYINFLVIEDTDPITAGFDLQPLSTIQQEVNASGNVPYEDAMSYILQINNFQGTPYTIWGKDQIGGADAIDVGNATVQENSTYPLGYMTHAQVFQQLGSPNDQFAWTEYAAADLYVAMICSTLNNTPPVCSLSVIPEIEAAYGY